VQRKLGGRQLSRAELVLEPLDADAIRAAGVIA